MGWENVNCQFMNKNGEIAFSLLLCQNADETSFVNKFKDLRLSYYSLQLSEANTLPAHDPGEKDRQGTPREGSDRSSVLYQSR